MTCLYFWWYLFCCNTQVLPELTPFRATDANAPFLLWSVRRVCVMSVVWQPTGSHAAPAAAEEHAEEDAPRLSTVPTSATGVTRTVRSAGWRGHVWRVVLEGLPVVYLTCV